MSLRARATRSQEIRSSRWHSCIWKDRETRKVRVLGFRLPYKKDHSSYLCQRLLSVGRPQPELRHLLQKLLFSPAPGHHQELLERLRHVQQLAHVNRLLEFGVQLKGRGEKNIVSIIARTARSPMRIRLFTWCLRAVLISSCSMTFPSCAGGPTLSSRKTNLGAWVVSTRGFPARHLQKNKLQNIKFILLNICQTLYGIYNNWRCTFPRRPSPSRLGRAATLSPGFPPRSARTLSWRAAASEGPSRRTRPPKITSKRSSKEIKKNI